MNTYRYVIVNAKTGQVVYAGRAYEFEDHAVMAMRTLQEAHPEVEFVVGQVLYRAAA